MQENMDTRRISINGDSPTVQIVKNPPHYMVKLKDGRDIEVVDIIKAVLTEEEFKGFIKGNAIKYILRAGKKGNELQDLMKSREVLGWLEEE